MEELKINDEMTREITQMFRKWELQSIFINILPA